MTTKTLGQLCNGALSELNETIAGTTADVRHRRQCGLLQLDVRDFPGRNTADNGVRLDILADHSPGSDYRSIADNYARQDGDVGTNPDTVADFHRMTCHIATA